MSKEAMKLALEALEDLIPLCDPGFSVCYDVNKAITALREALAEQKSGIKQVIELYDSPDQPSQQCKWPTCQSEEYQQALAEQIKRELVGEQPAPTNCRHCGGANNVICAGQCKEQPAQQEPVALKWQQAPVKTQWGDDMVVASVAIDKDHTLSLYCEHDQTTKVDAMFAQRTWVNATTWRGLTDEEITDIWAEASPYYHEDDFARAIEAKLKEKNNG